MKLFIKTLTTAIAIILVGFLAIFLIGVTVQATSQKDAPEPTPAPAPAPSFYVPSPGDIVVVTQTFIGATREDLERALNLFSAGDEGGLGEMIMSGRCYITDPSTRARVIGMTAMLREVRIIDGDLQGMAGWIVAEAVRGKAE